MSLVYRCKECSTTYDSYDNALECLASGCVLNKKNEITEEIIENHHKLLKKLTIKKKDLPNTLMTLPTDSAQRKEYPLASGCLSYFPAALAGVANISKKGNDKHNPGQPLHHARGKSTDHADCIIRHLIDTQDLLAQINRGNVDPALSQKVLEEVSSLAWRALAYSQELHERFGAPLAPGAKND